MTGYFQNSKIRGMTYTPITGIAISFPVLLILPEIVKRSMVCDYIMVNLLKKLPGIRQGMILKKA